MTRKTGNKKLSPFTPSIFTKEGGSYAPKYKGMF